MTRSRARTVTIAGTALAGALAAALGGCQGIGGLLGGGGGVMPASDVGLPPSMRGSVKGASSMTGAVDDDGRPVNASPTRQLALPKTIKGEARTADAGPRRISRDEIDDPSAGGGSGSNNLGPQMGANGRMGLGGKF